MKVQEHTGYSENGLSEKLKKFAKNAGYEVVEKVMWLYLASKHPSTPAWAVTVIYSSLAYFILPVDAIADFIPVVGYSDDLGALAAALGTVAVFVSEDMKLETKEKLENWFKTEE